jgi:hypothetical protein
MNIGSRSNGYLSNVLLLAPKIKLLLQRTLSLHMNLLSSPIASIVDDIVAGEVGTKKVFGWKITIHDIGGRTCRLTPTTAGDGSAKTAS